MAQQELFHGALVQLRAALPGLAEVVALPVHELVALRLVLPERAEAGGGVDARPGLDLLEGVPDGLARLFGPVAQEVNAPDVHLS